MTRRNAAGHDLGPVDLEPTIFGLEPNRAVLHQVVTAQLAASRAGTQSTKTRAEVRGGGAKPFRQKGTGRARQGSSRSPSMSGGGVALGPKPRSYAQRTPKKMVRLALLSALSDRADIGRIALIDDWRSTEPKTKDAVTILRKLELTAPSSSSRPRRARRRSARSPTCPRPRRPRSRSSRPTTSCGPTGSLFSDRTLPTSVSDFSGTHVRPEVEEGEAAADAPSTPATTTEPAAQATKATKPAAKAAKATKAAEEAVVEDAEPTDAEAAAGGPTEDGTEEADADA